MLSNIVINEPIFSFEITFFFFLFFLFINVSRTTIIRE